MNIYIEAFGIFFKIGAFTIGGGYAMVPLIENEIVTKRNWISKDDFIDLLAIAQSAPGILAVNISIFIGYKLRGIWGSLVTALGTVLPSFVIILAIAMFFHNFKDNRNPEGISIDFGRLCHAESGCCNQCDYSRTYPFEDSFYNGVVFEVMKKHGTGQYDDE